VHHLHVPVGITKCGSDREAMIPRWCRRDPVHDQPFVRLGPSSHLPGSTVLVLQKVAERKVGKNRLSFDVYVYDLDAATVRVEVLGGQRWAQHRAILDDGGLISRIMADPEGDEFCLVLAPSKAAVWRPASDDVVVRHEGRSSGADERS
jgi:Glyoxalase-like domain